MVLTPFSLLVGLKSWFELWSASQDIRLQLLSTKIQYNMLAHRYLSSDHDFGVEEQKPMLNENGSHEEYLKEKKPLFYLPTSSPSRNSVSRRSASPRETSLNPPVIYGPDVFKLDTQEYALCSSLITFATDHSFIYFTAILPKRMVFR